MNEFMIIQRIFAEKSEEIINATEKYPSAFSDGVAVVTYNGICYEDERVSNYENYISFVEKMKEAGISFQSNVSKTIGHSDNDKSEDAESHMEDAYGNRGISISCPRNEDFKKSFWDTLVKYAKTKPTVLWIDDDFRLSFHSPVGYGCFCGECIEKFNKKHSFSFDRDALRKAILSGDMNVRKLWQSFNREAMTELVRLARSAMDSVDESIILGFMQVNPELVIYECPDFKAWIDIAKNKNGEIYFRHGSGFYADFKPFEVVDKNISIARLCAMTEGEGVKNLTEEVTSPYIKRTKSMRITLTEALMNIGMANADGVMDEGIKGNLSEQLKNGNLVSLMNEESAYLNEAKRLIKGKHQRGAYPYFDKDLWLYNERCDHIGKMGDLGSNNWKNLFYTGVPITFRKDSADVLILSGTTVKAMKRKEILFWLRKGIFADGSSALLLNDIMGENVTGIKDAKLPLESMGTGEAFTDSEVNGRFKGYVRRSYWGSNNMGGAVLTADGSEVLSLSSSPKEAEKGIVGTTLYENKYGGRVAVLSRGPFSDDILSDGKVSQIKNIFNILSGGRLPLFLESESRVGLSLWEGDDGERVAFIYNMDFDFADVKMISDGAYRAELLCEDGTFEFIAEGDTAELKNVEPFGVRIVKLTK